MDGQVINVQLLYEMVGSLLYENNVLRLRLAELEQALTEAKESDGTTD